MVTGTMRAINSTGDSKIEWDKNNPLEVAEARNSFHNYLDKGFTAYKGKAIGKGAKLTVFDSDLEMIVLVPPAVGG